MKTKFYCSFTCLITSLIVILLSGTAVGQVDTTAVAQPDTTVAKDQKSKEEKPKRKNEFIAYAGVSFNHLAVSDSWESTIAPGYLLGFSYKQGKFFYWQVGIRYNNAMYELNPSQGDPVEGEDNLFSVADFDLPLNVGINLLSATNRILALRLFIGAVPSYAFNVGENDMGIDKDNINAFNVYGQAGVGINIAFVVLEVGYNYGFMDLMDSDQSKPGQVFVNLGFRF
jgi:hypothetical protein